MDRLPDGLVERVAVWTAAVWTALLLGVMVLDRQAAGGLALGGAIGLGSLLVYRALVYAWVRPRRRWRTRVGFWVVSILKWPLLMAVLYAGLRCWRVSGEWVCVGVALVPAVTVALAVRALVADGRRSGAATGAE